jgi:hypothetical protein
LGEQGLFFLDKNKLNNKSQTHKGDVLTKKTIWTGIVLTAMSFMGLVPQAAAAAGDSITFSMVRPDGIACLSNDVHGRVTVSDLGAVQNMHVEVSGLAPNTSFTLFITQHKSRPFGLSWYQGEITTNSDGRGVGDFSGIFSAETFTLDNEAGGSIAVQMAHLAMWFADADDAAKAGCPAIVTPFDGDHSAGILVLSTSNFRDDSGPLLKLKDEEEVPAAK